MTRSRGDSRQVKAAIAVARHRVEDPQPSPIWGYTVHIKDPWPRQIGSRMIHHTDKAVLVRLSHEEMLKIAMEDMGYHASRAAAVLDHFRSRGGTWYAYL